MKRDLTDLFDNISCESAEEIAAKYEVSAKEVDKVSQAKIYNRVMTMINANIYESNVNSPS